MRTQRRWIAVFVIVAVLLLAWTWRYAQPATQVRHDGLTRSVPGAEAAGRTAPPPVRAAAAATATSERDSDTPETAHAMARCNRDHLRAVRQRAVALSASPHGRDRLASVLLSRMGSDGGWRESGLAAALERAPDDALIAWAAAQGCRAPHCDQPAAIARVLRLEPDNVLAWAMAIAAEANRGDLVQADRLLQQAAGAPRADFHSGETARLVVAAIGPLPPSPACDRASAAIASALGLGRPGTMDDLSLAFGAGIANAQLPAISGILALCPGGRGIARHRQAACRRVFLRMAQSEELLVRGIGVRGLVAHAPTARERAQWRERLRELAWMSRQAGTVMQPSHLPLVWEQGEASVMVALLEAAGRWPAPASWLPDDPETRALIAGAAPPAQ